MKKKQTVVAPITTGTYVKCKAHKTDGSPCGRPPIKGGTVCYHHGGAARQVQKSARQRLMELQHPAIAALQQVVDDETREDRDRLRAAQLILDRTGMGPSQTVEVDQVKPWQLAINAVLGKKGGKHQLPEGVDAAEYQAAEAKDAVRRAAELEKENRKLKRQLKKATSIPGEVVDEGDWSTEKPAQLPAATTVPATDEAQTTPKRASKPKAAKAEPAPMRPKSKDARDKAMRRAGYQGRL